MFISGHSPDGLNTSTIQPLVRNKYKSLTYSTNFREIVEWVILNNNLDSFAPIDLQ